MTYRASDSRNRRQWMTDISAMFSFTDILVLIVTAVCIVVFLYLFKSWYLTEIVAVASPAITEPQNGPQNDRVILPRSGPAKPSDKIPAAAVSAEAPVFSSGSGTGSEKTASSVKPVSFDRTVSNAATPSNGTIQAPEHSQHERPADLQDEPLPDDPDAVLAIAGRVRNEAGEALSGIEIILRPHRSFQSDGQPLTAVIERRTLSNWDGSFAFDRLGEGEYELRTTATDFYPAARSVVPAGVDSADLVLSRLWQLTVRGVIEDFDGPVANAVDNFTRTATTSMRIVNNPSVRPPPSGGGYKQPLQPFVNPRAPDTGRRHNTSTPVAPTDLKQQARPIARDGRSNQVFVEGLEGMERLLSSKTYQVFELLFSVPGRVFSNEAVIARL